MPDLGEIVRPLARRLAGIPGRVIPYLIQKPVLSLALNEAFRRPLRQGDIEFLQGAKVRIRVTDLGIDWLIRVDAERFTPIDRDRREDVSISGESIDFLRLASRTADPDTLFFQRRIRVEGDTELGLGIKNTMDSMDWQDLPLPLRKVLRGLSALPFTSSLRGSG